MPTYDYECDSCGYELEIMQSFKDKPLSKCPECGSKKFEKIISGGAGLVFKGSGFYVNDSKSSSSGAPTKANDSKQDSSKKEATTAETNTKNEAKESASTKKTSVEAKPSQKKENVS